MRATQILTLQSNSNVTRSEDFGRDNALRILQKYRPHIACFNDDIQGTGIVGLAAVIAGLHVSHVPLEDARIVVFGAGSAGIGVSDRLVSTIAIQAHKSNSDARKQVWYVPQSSLFL